MYRRRIVRLLFRRRVARSGSFAVAVAVAVACASVFAAAGCGGISETGGAAEGGGSRPAGEAATTPASTGSTYALLQMNLCLSGFSGCNGKPAYPAVVDEAVARIRQLRPDAVTVNEGCRGDAVRIARRTGYHVRFSRVIYAGELLPCVRPGGRGLFGDAVLTKAAIERTDAHDFAGQAGPERRRWLCVRTAAGVDVCTSHLNTLSAVEAPANDAQCAELRALLARRGKAGAVIFGGDVNRRRSCAPDGAWTRTDRSAAQAAGLQHVYGSRALSSPAAQVVPATNTDHDLLLVRARLAARR
jgi:endonuclease/exonuclease/phosphatase family metal-dependent hydrolase